MSLWHEWDWVTLGLLQLLMPSSSSHDNERSNKRYVNISAWVCTACNNIRSYWPAWYCHSCARSIVHSVLYRSRPQSELCQDDKVALYMWSIGLYWSKIAHQSCSIMLGLPRRWGRRQLFHQVISTRPIRWRSKMRHLELSSVAESLSQRTLDIYTNAENGRSRDVMARQKVTIPLCCWWKQTDGRSSLRLPLNTKGLLWCR